MSFCNLHNGCPSAIYTTVIPPFTQLLLSRHLRNCCYPVIYTTVFLSFTQRQTPQCFTKVESLFDCLNLPIIIDTVINRVLNGPCIIHVCFSAWTRVRKPPANTQYTCTSRANSLPDRLATHTSPPVTALSFSYSKEGRQRRFFFSFESKVFANFCR